MKPTISNRPTMTMSEVANAMRDVVSALRKQPFLTVSRPEDTHSGRCSAPEERGADVLKSCEWILSGGSRR